ATDNRKHNADDPGAAGRDTSYRYGRLNVYKAVRAALGSSGTDTTAPVVTISSPANGTTVGRNVQVHVQAGDEVGVSRVDLFIDGRYYTSSASATPVFGWNKI